MYSPLNAVNFCPHRGFLVLPRGGGAYTGVPAERVMLGSSGWDETAELAPYTKRQELVFCLGPMVPSLSSIGQRSKAWLPLSAA